MKTARLILLLLPAATAGCQWSHRFHLRDFDRLDPGASTREDVERILGPSERAGASIHVSSERDVVIPPAPFSFVLFPLFFHAHDRTFEFTAGFTPEGILSSGTLEVMEQSRTRVLLVFGGSNFGVHLTDAELDVLKRLQKKGIEVKIFTNPVLCFGGVIGGDSISLDDYLRNRRQD